MPAARDIFCLAVWLATIPSAVGQNVSPEHAEQIKAGMALFQSTIRPALVEHCVRCHGGDKKRSGFDLTSRAALLLGGDSGLAVDLANPQSSHLLALLRHEEEPLMPAKQPQLPKQLVAQIAQWIELGAPYDQPLVEKHDKKREMVITDGDRQFWSFRPLSDVSPPNLSDPWIQTDIDRFILAKLIKVGLEPNQVAPRRTLIRRAYLDLIGLPPTPQQVARFIDAPVETLFDELLTSPHYGERWARHWLDVARFAESHGFEQDYDRKYAFHYRDFVIKALNADMPYDQFVRWQLAGDELAPDDPLAMMATGFLGAGVFPTQLTEKEFESARYDELDDMAATTGTAMLGLTIGCARCHDHKFDPIPTEDYYRFVSTFTTTIRSEIDVDLDPTGYQRALAAWENEQAGLIKARATYQSSPGVQAKFNRWLETDLQSLQRKSSWTIPSFAETHSQGGATLTPQTDGSVLVSGANPETEEFTLTVKTQLQNLKLLRIEALADDSMKRRGPGRAANGNFALSDLHVSIRPANDQIPPNDKKADPTPVKLTAATATHQQDRGNLSAASAIDNDAKGTGWAVDKGGIGKDQAIVFGFSEPIGFAGGTVLTLVLTFETNGQHTIGRPRISVSADADAPIVAGEGQSEALAEALAAHASGNLSSEHRQTLFAMFAREDAEWNQLDNAVRTSAANKPVQNIAKVQVSSEGFPPTKHNADGRGFPHFYPQTYYLNRGDVNQKQDMAPQGFLQVLMRNGNSTADWQVEPPEGCRTSYRRRALANWITDHQNGAGHLLARVMVNRIWQHHFGRGLVATPNDFGFQGSPPTHPELLDYLASQLIENGWKLKPLHRQIMLSAAYQQSSQVRPKQASLDPDNRWLWRFAPRRLEAEVVRDSMLAVSGLLDPTMFGPGTLDAGHHRRSIYFMIKRSKLVPMMQIFDQPEPLVSQGSRPSTTIAPQALLIMNSPHVVEWVDALAKRIDVENLDSAVQKAYEIVLCRTATATELHNARAFLDEQTASYGFDHARQQALADFCQIMFGLNEFIYPQ